MCMAESIETWTGLTVTVRSPSHSTNFQLLCGTAVRVTTGSLEVLAIHRRRIEHNMAKAQGIHCHRNLGRRVFEFGLDGFVAIHGDGRHGIVGREDQDALPAGTNFQPASADGRQRHHRVGLIGAARRIKVTVPLPSVRTVRSKRFWAKLPSADRPWPGHHQPRPHRRVRRQTIIEEPNRNRGDRPQDSWRR